MGGGESFLAPFANCKQLFHQTELSGKAVSPVPGHSSLGKQLSQSRARPAWSFSV